MTNCCCGCCCCLRWKQKRWGTFWQWHHSSGWSLLFQGRLLVSISLIIHVALFSLSGSIVNDRWGVCCLWWSEGVEDQASTNERESATARRQWSQSKSETTSITSRAEGCASAAVASEPLARFNFLLTFHFLYVSMEDYMHSESSCHLPWLPVWATTRRIKNTTFILHI